MLPVFTEPAGCNCNKNRNQRLLKSVELAHGRGLTWSARGKEDDMARVRKPTGHERAAQEPGAALRLVQEPQNVRAERVRELKQQIADGTYNPDPREIAKKLLERGF